MNERLNDVDLVFFLAPSDKEQGGWRAARLICSATSAARLRLDCRQGRVLLKELVGLRNLLSHPLMYALTPACTYSNYDRVFTVWGFHQLRLTSFCLDEPDEV